jgi:alkenylglycerophosphocholine/alkenylglycerophosphoethanolamine hydrolase
LTSRTLVVLAVVTAAGYLVASLAGWTLAAVLLKPLPALAMAAMVLSRPGTLARWMAAGLAFGAVGDVALELGRFIPGLAAFLVGHVCYAIGFWADGARLRPLRLVPFALYTGAMLAFLWPTLGPVRLAVVLYAAAFTATMWRAAARLPGPGTSLGLAGAVVFAASDTLIALERFRGIDDLAWAIMPLYWIGQGLIAASVLRAAGPAVPAPRLQPVM